MASSTRREPRRSKGQAGDSREVGRGAGQPTKRSRLALLIAKGLSEDEARRIASNIAKLATLLSEGGLSVGFGRPSRFNRAGDNRHG